MFFGRRLKELRLKYAGGDGMGLHRFAAHINTKPSILSNWEMGYDSYPREEEWFKSIASVLDLPEEQEEELYNLWKSPFVMQKMPAFFPSPFICTSSGKPLTEDKLRELMADLSERAELHNKKADEWNKRLEENK